MDRRLDQTSKQICALLADLRHDNCECKVQDAGKEEKCQCEFQHKGALLCFLLHFDWLTNLNDFSVSELAKVTLNQLMSAVYKMKNRSKQTLTKGRHTTCTEKISALSNDLWNYHGLIALHDIDEDL
jgi:hypothetical protein